ncbi:hypothetical protein [Acaryochloris thomasi]|uniref:hypothetical protein n=1 Tax=Acaryochloris thomasi TaxID=2929456 RepID=UPI001314F479|nr:hypothetical protein [Acaryochloris thomasi]
MHSNSALSLSTINRRRLAQRLSQEQTTSDRNTAAFQQPILPFIERSQWKSQENLW